MAVLNWRSTLLMFLTLLLLGAILTEWLGRGNCPHTPICPTHLMFPHRSTTVYLSDRRDDMLPTILSGNMCSLLSNVDRLVMVVLWIMATL